MTLSLAGFLPGVSMQSLTVSGAQVRTGWSTALSRVVGALLLFEIISGLAITFGPFHPAIEWGLLLHTMVGLVPVAPLCVVLLCWEHCHSVAPPVFWGLVRRCSALRPPPRSDTCIWFQRCLP